jgi:hypothetical protein
MNWLGATELLLLAALMLVLLWLVWVFGRRRWLSRQGGTFDCSARLETATPNRGWVLGVARYSGDWLDWHRVFGFSLSPRLRFNRTAIGTKWDQLQAFFGEAPDVAVARLNQRLGMPAGLTAMGVTEDMLRPVAEDAMKDHCHATNPRLATPDDYVAILRESA